MIELTFPQEDIYYQQMINSEQSSINLSTEIMIQGDLNLAILIKAYKKLLNQHPILNSYFKIETQPLVSFP